MIDRNHPMPETHVLRRRLVVVQPAAWAVALLALAGCAGLGGPPRLTLTQADIARALERQFPQERRLLEVLDVTMQAPRVRLLPERNRVASVLDIAVRERLLGTRWNGQLDFDAALRWEARDRTLRLHQVRVADLRTLGDEGVMRASAPRAADAASHAAANAAGVAAGDATTTAAAAGAAALAKPAVGSRDARAMMERLGAALAERALEDLAVYTLPAERAEALRAFGVAPGGVTVTERGVEVTFTAAAAPAASAPR